MKRQRPPPNPFHADPDSGGWPPALTQWDALHELHCMVEMKDTLLLVPHHLKRTDFSPLIGPMMSASPAQPSPARCCLATTLSQVEELLLGSWFAQGAGGSCDGLLRLPQPLPSHATPTVRRHLVTAANPSAEAVEGGGSILVCQVAAPPSTASPGSRTHQPLPLPQHEMNESASGMNRCLD